MYETIIVFYPDIKFFIVFSSNCTKHFILRINARQNEKIFFKMKLYNNILHLPFNFAKDYRQYFLTTYKYYPK
jgi:hypothetical protein